MDQLLLVLITFVAATVIGALGYGFSSIAVPVALLFYTNHILNPALLFVELVIIGYSSSSTARASRTFRGA